MCCRKVMFGLMYSGELCLPVLYCIRHFVGAAVPSGPSFWFRCNFVTRDAEDSVPYKGWREATDIPFFAPVKNKKMKCCKKKPIVV